MVRNVLGALTLWVATGIQVALLYWSYTVLTGYEVTTIEFPWVASVVVVCTVGGFLCSSAGYLLTRRVVSGVRFKELVAPAPESAGLAGNQIPASPPREEPPAGK